MKQLTINDNKETTMNVKQSLDVQKNVMKVLNKIIKPNADQEAISQELDEIALGQSEDQVKKIIIEVAKAFKNIDYALSPLEEAKKELDAKMKKFKLIQDFIKTWTHEMMDDLGEKEVSCPSAKVSLCKKAARLEITDQEKIPSTFFEIVPTLKKRDLLSALKDGEKVEGAEIVDDETYVKIS